MGGQKQEQDEFEESLRQLDMVMEQTGIYAWIIDIETRRARWLNRWKPTEKFDISHSYVENIEQLAKDRGRIHPDDLPKFNQMFNELWDGKEQIKEEIRQRSSGKDFYYTYEYCGTIIEWKGGKPKLAIGTVRDVSAEKSMEITYVEAMESMNSFKKNIISSGRINVSKKEVEELFVNGNKVNEEPLPTKNFKESMEPIFLESEISDESNHLLSVDGMQEMFLAGKKEVALHYWAKLKTTNQYAWMETKYRLLERHDTGDLIAFFYNHDSTNDKLNKALRDHLTTHSYERSSAILVREKKWRPIIELSSSYASYWKKGDYNQGLKTFCENEMALEDAKIAYDAMCLETIVSKLEEMDNYIVEYNTLDKDGVERRKQVEFNYIDRDFGVILTTQTDIALYSKLRYYSRHDALTGLYNRETFFETAKRMIDQAPDKKYVFVHIDIEQFKLFNSAFGNEEGNRLLQKAADILKQTVGSYECCSYGRMQSDVFGFCAVYERETLLKNLDYVNSGIRDFKTDYMIRFVFGLFIMENGKVCSLEEASTKASIAAKKCKNNINENYSIYDNKEDEMQRREQRINNVMRTALEEKQFKVFLQPKYDLTNGDPCGAEALVRWMDPTEGLVSPGLFIPIFEKNGFIANLDQYMWEEVCILLRKWIDAGYQPDPVSVNISRISLYNPNLVAILKRLVKKYGLPPQLLHLEITESAYMSNQAMMRDTIDDLHEAGFVILMDDFGSGYSSLNTLKDFHIDILKIDMKFLPENTNIKRAEIILASMIHMAKWLGMKVIMEGVETEEQNIFLKGTGCDCIQGYYYARPMPAKEYEVDYVYKKKAVVKKKTSTELEALPEIVLIDDEKMQRELMAKFLENDYKLTLFDAAEPALAYLQRHKKRVRMIISDNYLTGMNGIDLFECCCQDSELEKIPKLLVTVDGDETCRIASVEHGADDYLVKPLSNKVLLAYVRKWMRISENASARTICNTLDYLNQAAAVFMYYTDVAYLEFANKSFLSLMGYTMEQLDGKTFKDLLDTLIYPKDRDKVQTMLDELEEKGICGAIYRILNSDTYEYRWFQVKGRIIEDIHGKKAYFTFADVTVQQEIIEKLELMPRFEKEWRSSFEKQQEEFKKQL